MRLVFINHCHPETPHVCATRAREFAYALSNLGHSVILLTENLKGQAADISPNTKIQTHDFSEPLFLSTTPRGHPLIRALRANKLPWGIRQAIIIYYYVIHKGVFTDWRSGTQPYLPIIAEKFKPDLIWASFGNTDCWNIAQDLADISSCPWVPDVKDLWSSFIPNLLQNIVSRHFNNYAAITALSTHYHSTDILKHFKTESEIIYSGFSDKYLIADSLPQTKIITISLTGGIYNEPALVKMVEGLQLWVSKFNEKKQSEIMIVYAGNDTAKVKSATAQLSKLCKIDIRGYLSIDKLRDLQRTSIANLYVKTNSYHHKIIEMLSVGRPIICLPEETKEALAITESTGVSFYSCRTPEEISSALDQSIKQKTIDITKDSGLKNLTWEAQAIKLQNLFQNIINQKKSSVVRPKQT
jgi:hypothetical protein